MFIDFEFVRIFVHRSGHSRSVKSKKYRFGDPGAGSRLPIVGICPVKTLRQISHCQCQKNGKTVLPKLADAVGPANLA